MKKLIFVLSIASLLIFSSCGSDDGPSVGLNGTVTYNGTSYTIANGFFNLSSGSEEAIGTFFLADGILTSSSPNQVSSSDSQIFITMTARSRGSSVLTNGDYATSTDVPDLTVDLAITTVENGDQVRREAFTGGTISISGSENTYNITFDASFGSGITLTGSANGTYASL